MHPLTKQLEEMNEAVSSAYNAKSSIAMLKDAANGQNGDFYSFFNRAYTAYIKGQTPHAHEQQWAMLHTYFQDLCEHLSSSMRDEMIEKIDSGTMTMESLSSYCDAVLQLIITKIQEVEAECSKVVAAIARETVLEAAA